MTTDDVTRLFDAEAQVRWGDTAEYQESARRTKDYTKAQWAEIAAEAAAINARFVALMTEGAPPTDPRVRAAVDAHRDHISRWFYPCSPAMHRSLAELYVNDPRFTRNIDKAAPGLAQYLTRAITA